MSDARTLLRAEPAAPPSAATSGDGHYGSIEVHDFSFWYGE